MLPRSAWLRRASAVAFVAAVATGCATPVASLTPTLSPRAEALSYFPADAPLVALVDTDPRGQAGRLARMDGLDPVRAYAEEMGLPVTDLEGILGNEAAVGLPRFGGPPLLVLLAPDRSALERRVEARVDIGRADAAGEYRGASLYIAPRHAFAVRGEVLLVGETTAQLREALDVRAGDETFDPSVLARAIPRRQEAPLARIYGDLRPLVSRADPRLRALPLVSAAQDVGATVTVNASGAQIDARTDLAGESLVELDLPLSPGNRAPRAARLGTAPTFSVRDLAHVLGAAQRGLGQAAPLAALRFGFVRDELRRRAKVDLDRDVVSRLHGPATVVLSQEGPLLRAEPSRPEPLRRALDRAARRLPAVLARGRLHVGGLGREGGLHRADLSGLGTIRFGMVGEVFVAGRAPVARLRRLARARTARPAGAEGPLTFSLQREGGRVDGWVRGTPDVLEAGAHWTP